MQKNVLFRGCTRPAMLFGVPYVPFAFAVGGCFLLAIYTNFFLLLLVPVIIYIMRLMAKRDEMIFRLLGLRLQMKFLTRNRALHSGMWVYAPVRLRDENDKRKDKKK
jgi:type IV secretion system protein VirB3